MDNPEYTFQILELFSKVPRSKEIPRELEEYISFVARTGDPVFQWPLVKVLIREKLLAVLDEFVLEQGGPLVDVPACPNVDPFDYDGLKELVLRQLDAFVYPPFTIQRICELLAAPRKEYARVDKYMRAIEKNVLVVSASDPIMKRTLEPDPPAAGELAAAALINGILYDKTDDSLTGFANHVFASAEEASAADQLDAKLDQTDVVHRIIDESWTEEAANDQFKLSASADFELQQFEDDTEKNVVVQQFEDDTEKSVVEDHTVNTSESSSDLNSSCSSFGDTSATMLQPDLPEMTDDTNISFDAPAVDTSITSEDEDFSDASSKDANDTYEFKDQSLETADLANSTSELPANPDISADLSTGLETTAVDSSNPDDQQPEYDGQLAEEQQSTTTLEMMAVAVTDNAPHEESMIPNDESMISNDDSMTSNDDSITSNEDSITSEDLDTSVEQQPQPTFEETASNSDNVCSSSLDPAQDQQSVIEAQELDESMEESSVEKAYSSGDNLESGSSAKSVPEEQLELEVEADIEATPTQMDTSQSAE